MALNPTLYVQTQQLTVAQKVIYTLQLLEVFLYLAKYYPSLRDQPRSHNFSEALCTLAPKTFWKYFVLWAPQMVTTIHSIFITP